MYKLNRKYGIVESRALVWQVKAFYQMEQEGKAVKLVKFNNQLIAAKADVLQTVDLTDKVCTGSVIVGVVKQCGCGPRLHSQFKEHSAH